MKKLFRTSRVPAGRFSSRLCFLLSFTFLFVAFASAQKPVKNEESAPQNFKEDLFIRTDRDIYISGEEVHLKVYKLNGLTEQPSDLSKVIYLELLDKNNFPLRQVKIMAEKYSGSSYFVLPDNINSGNYLIRAYTSWMKNFSSDRFFYKSISVINPFESMDHLNTHVAAVVPKERDSVNRIQLKMVNENGKRLTGESLNKSGKQIKYSVSFSKKDYSSREKVVMEISASDMEGNPVESDLSVSVAKTAVVNPENATGFYLFNHNDDNISHTDPQQDQLAEIEGLMVTGFLRLKSTNEPLRKTDLSLSFVGKSAHCQFGKTDDNGEFNFIINESGQNEIVIQPLSQDIIGYYVELNQPFSSSFSMFRPDAFYLDSSRIDALNKVIIGMQVNNVYQPFRQKMKAVQKPEFPDFYGKPENTIKMADYIELTSVREVVKEIMPNVYTEKQNGKYDFKLINKYRGQPFENKPLILVDGVPMYDFEQILNLSSKEIEKADVINTRYFFSDNVFDGIVSFVTKKGNLSAIDFDNTIFRQVYDGCQFQNGFYSPDYGVDSLKNNHIADYRNTLYWNADVHTDRDGKAEVTFYTSDESGDFSVLVEGISEDGKNGFVTSELKVK